MFQCGHCSQELNGYNVCVFRVDGRDQCEDGRFESPTYSLVIKCHVCGKELLRQEHENSDYGEREIKASQTMKSRNRAT